MRRSLAGLLAWASLAGGGAASAGAAWNPPQTLDHPVAAAAGNAHGETAFIWQVRESGRLKLGLSRLHGSYAQAQLRLRDGQLTPPQPVSPTSGHVVRSLAIGVDGAGTATAAWIDAMRLAVMVAVRPAGGRFGPPVEVSSGASLGERVRLVVAPDGAAAIIRSTMAQITVVQRPAGRCARSNSRACFGPTRVIRSPPTSQGFTGPFSPSDASFGPDDRLYITWPNHLAIAGGGRRPGPTLGVPTGQLQALAVLPDGSAVLAWIGTTNADDMTVRTAVVDPTGRHLTAPTVVASPWSAAATGACGDLALEANPQGETTLVWGCQPLASGSPPTALAVAIRPDGGTFAPARTVSVPGADARHPVIAVDRRGNTILAYSASNTVVAQVRAPGRDFAEPVPIGTGQPSFALAAASGVTLGWPGRLPNTTTLVDWTP